MASLLTFTLASDTELPVLYRALVYTEHRHIQPTHASLTCNDFGEDFMNESMIQTNWEHING